MWCVATLFSRASEGAAERPVHAFERGFCALVIVLDGDDGSGSSTLLLLATCWYVSMSLLGINSE